MQGVPLAVRNSSELFVEGQCQISFQDLGGHAERFKRGRALGCIFVGLRFAGIRSAWLPWGGGVLSCYVFLCVAGKSFLCVRAAFLDGEGRLCQNNERCLLGGTEVSDRQNL